MPNQDGGITPDQHQGATFRAAQSSELTRRCRTLNEGRGVMEFASAAPLDRLRLVQERLDGESQREAMTGGDSVDPEALEKNFVANAASYSTRKGISYRHAGHAASNPPCSAQPAPTASSADNGARRVLLRRAQQR